MATGIKLVMVGGGSSYTPDIAEMIIARKLELPVREWVLMDIDPQRLEVVGGFTRWMLERAEMPTRLTLTTDLKQAVTDADFVLVCTRVGGSAGRVLDETIPVKHGLIGQETTPPGGMMLGLRQIPVILDVAHAMEKSARPNSWLISLANPAGMLSEAVNRHSRIYGAGLCNGPTVVRQAMSHIFDARGNDLFVKMVGLNHLGFSKVYVRGEDVTHRAMSMLEGWLRENVPGLDAVPLEIQEFAGWISAHYVRFYYMLPEAQAQLAKTGEKGWEKFRPMLQKRLPGVFDNVPLDKVANRAELVQLLEGMTMKFYAEKDLRGFEIMRATRGGRGYGEAGLSLISAIHNNKNEILVIDVPNKGSINGLARDVVVETPCLVNRTGAYPLPMDDLPLHILSFLQGAKNYELLAVEAAVTGSYHAALEALVANPLIRSFYQAKAALDELLVAHKAHLPRFADAIARLERGESPLH